MDDAAAISQFLESRVMGQPHAISTLASAVARSPLRRPGKPRGAFLFAGATGVGKTELCKALAEHLFKGKVKDHFRRFAMSEYQDKDAFGRMMNSGGDQGKGRLPEAIEQLNRAGGGVLLIDETEKAPLFQKAFLELLDEGRITDGHGFLHRLDWIWVIMTTNLGGAEAAQLGLNGAPAVTVERVVNAAAARWFGYEGLGRFDAVVTFRGLSAPVQRNLAAREALAEHHRLEGLIDSHLQRHEFTVPVLPPSSAVVNFLCVQGINTLLGARNLKRTVETAFGDAVVGLLHALSTGLLNRYELLAGSAVLGWAVEERPDAPEGFNRRRIVLKPLYPDTAGRSVPFDSLAEHCFPLSDTCVPALVKIVPFDSPSALSNSPTLVAA